MWREDSGDRSDRDYWRYSEPVGSRCALLFMVSVREVFVEGSGGSRVGEFTGGLKKKKNKKQNSKAE